jgi:hypothetical protein
MTMMIESGQNAAHTNDNRFVPNFTVTGCQSTGSIV